MVGKPRHVLVTDDQIVASYQQTHSVFVTAAALGIGSTTAHRVLKKLKIPMNGLQEWRENATKFRGQEQEIRKSYESGMTMAELVQQFGEASTYAFKHAIRRAGGTLRENPAPLLKQGELENIKELSAAGMGQVGISLELGRSQSFISRIMRVHGVPTNSRNGSGHSMWRGGRYKSSGYFVVWVASDDPMAAMRNSHGYVLEHRLVMARKLGRVLSRSETVHHMDGNRENNDPANLELRQGKHGKHVVMCCLDCGSRNIGHAKFGLGTENA